MADAVILDGTERFRLAREAADRQRQHRERQQLLADGYRKPKAPLPTGAA